MTSFRDQIASVIVCVRIAVFCQETIIVVVGIFRDDAIVVLCQAGPIFFCAGAFVANRSIFLHKPLTTDQSTSILNL
jgi:hypothetical protein